MRYLAVIIPLSVMAAACAPVDGGNKPAPIREKQAKILEKQLKGKVAGEPVNCLPDFRATNLIRISDDMLLYRVSKNLVYQAKLRSSCPGLARDTDIIVTEKFGTRQCNGDLIYLVDRYTGFRGPTCSFGEFIPYRTAKK